MNASRIACLLARDAGSDCRENCDCVTMHRDELARIAYGELAGWEAAQVDSFIDLLIPMSTKFWHGGILHVQVDDLNTDLDSNISHGDTEHYGFPIGPKDWALAAAWDALSMPQRAIAVRLWHSRYPDDRP